MSALYTSSAEEGLAYHPGANGNSADRYAERRKCTYSYR